MPRIAVGHTSERIAVGHTSISPRPASALPRRTQHIMERLQNPESLMATMRKRERQHDDTSHLGYIRRLAPCEFLLEDGHSAREDRNLNV